MSDARARTMSNLCTFSRLFCFIFCGEWAIVKDWLERKTTIKMWARINWQRPLIDFQKVAPVAVMGNNRRLIFSNEMHGRRYNNIMVMAISTKAMALNRFTSIFAQISNHLFVIILVMISKWYIYTSWSVIGVGWALIAQMWCTVMYCASNDLNI